jgi:hypothetical protein
MSSHGTRIRAIVAVLLLWRLVSMGTVCLAFAPPVPIVASVSFSAVRVLPRPVYASHRFRPRLVPTGQSVALITATKTTDDIEEPTVSAIMLSSPLLGLMHLVKAFSYSYGKRIAIGCTGLILGAITVIPNFMMSDSGTRIAKKASNVGVLASLLFVIGGCVGACWGRWVALLPGVILQFAALTIH